MTFLLLYKKRLPIDKLLLNKSMLINSFSKAEFFRFKLNSNFSVRNFSNSFCLKLPLLKEQTEKTFIFFHDDLWDEEDWFRSRYCLRIMFSLKKYRENNPQAALPNELIDSNIVRKYVKLMLAYLKNTLVSDFDRINSKFLIFFYFLTKTNSLIYSQDKKRFILRNLFFAFFFSSSRLNYFFNVATMNPIISKNYIRFKHRLRYVTSTFPHGFFLLLYSPYKSSFNFSSSNLILSRQFVFFKRLFYLKNILDSKLIKPRNFNNSKYYFTSNQKSVKIKNPNYSSKLFKKIRILGAKIFKMNNSLNFNKFINIRKKEKVHPRAVINFSKRNVKYLTQSHKRTYLSFSNFSKDFFVINKNSFRRNLALFKKIFRKILLRKMHTLKLDEARLSFYFARNSASEAFLDALGFMEETKISLSKFYKLFNRSLKFFSSNYFKHINISLFLEKMLVNSYLNDRSFSFLDSYYMRVGKRKKAAKIIRKRPKVSLSLILKKIKAKVLKNSEKWLVKKAFIRAKKSKNKSLIFQLNFSSNFFEIVTSLYHTARTSVDFLFNLSRFLVKFQYTLKLLIIRKLFSVYRFLKLFCSFINLFYLLSRSVDPDSVLFAFRCFPFFYYFSSNFDKFNIKFTNFNKLKLQYLFKRMSLRYKFIFHKKFFERLDFIDFDRKKELNLKQKTMKLKLLRKNFVQEYIIGRQNLRNLEYFTDSVKRFVKRLSYLPKDSSNLLMNAFTRKNISFKRNVYLIKKKKRKIRNAIIYPSASFLNSKYVKLRYKKYKKKLRKFERKRMRELATIKQFRSHIDPIEFLSEPHIHRFTFMKNITRIDSKRRRKRFFINVLFFNKFLKEKKIAVMYHKILRGSHRLSVFHKFTNPFFLRLKLKRLFVFDKVRKTINRFSFLNSSAGFKSFLNRLSYFSFFHFNFVPSYSAENNKSVNFFFTKNYFIKNLYSVRNGFSIIKFWLISLKNSYFSLFLQPLFNIQLLSILNIILYEYLIILKFFAYRGTFFFFRKLNEIFTTFFSILYFLGRIKNSFLILSSSFRYSKKNNFKKYFSLNHRFFINIFKFNLANKLIKKYSTITIPKSLSNVNLKIKKKHKLFKFFFTKINFTFLKSNVSNFFFYSNVCLRIFLSKNFNFFDFISLYSLAISFNKFLLPKSVTSNLSLELQTFGFSKKFEHFQFSPFYFYYVCNKGISNVNLNLKNTVSHDLMPIKSFFGIGFFTFFYSSLRTSYSNFSKFIYTTIQNRKHKKGKLKKIKRKYNSPSISFKKYMKTAKYKNSLYYFSSKRRLYAGLRFSKPNATRNKIFKHYFFFRLKSKKERKKKLKSVKTFKKPYFKNKRRIKRNFNIGSVNHKKTVLRKKNYMYPIFMLNFFKRKKRLPLINSSLTAFLEDFSKKPNFFKFPFKKLQIDPKTREVLNVQSSLISANSLTYTNILFASTIFVRSLLKKRVNEIHDRFQLNPFKKLFYFSKYFDENKFCFTKNSLFSTFRVLVKYSKFYSLNLQKINYALFHLKLQRLFRLLAVILNQKKHILIDSENNLTSFSELDFPISATFYNEQLFLFTYLDIFSFAEFDVNITDMQYFFDLSSFCYLQCNELIEDFYSLELINLFFHDKKCVISDEFFFLCNTLIFFSNLFSIDYASDFHYRNFFLEDLSQNSQSDFTISLNSFFLNSDFITSLLNIYIYVLNFVKYNSLINLVVPLNFIISEFSMPFISYLKSLNFVKFIRQNKRKYLLFKEDFFYFLNSFFSFFFIKFFTVSNLICNSKILGFVVNLFLSTFKFNFHYNNKFLFKLLNNFKEFFFINFSKSKLKLKIKKLKFLISNIVKFKKIKNDKNFSQQNINLHFKKPSKKHFRYHKKFKKLYVSPILKKLVPKNKKVNINFVKSKKPSNIISHEVSTIASTLYDHINFKIFYFLRSKKFNNFFILNKWFKKKSRLSLMRSFFRKNRVSRRFFFKRRLRRRLKKFLFQKFYSRIYDFKLKTDRTFYHLFIMRKARSMKIFKRSKQSILNYKKSGESFLKFNHFKYFQKNRLEPFLKRLIRPLRLINRVRLNKRHLFLKSKFHPVIKQKVFMGFFVSPRFFSFKNARNNSLFFHFNSSNKLKQKLSLFLRLHRFLEFITRLIFKVKLYIRKKTIKMSVPDQFFIISKYLSLDSFSVILKIYRKIKLLIRSFFKRLSKYISRKRGSKDITIIRTRLNYNLSSVRFLFFYNFLSSKFLKFFVLRYFFFGDYLKLRFQFINRYLWFRTVPLNSFLLTPKVYIIITKVRNNFFLTAIDLYGRILYKSSPGIVKFTGSDKMSKYAWFEASLDFFDGFLEFFRYFLKSKKKKKVSYSGIRLDREYNLRYNYKKRKFSAFLYPLAHYLFEKRKIKKKARKRRAKLKVRLRRFFVISKGASDFNVRIFLKGMVSERFYVSRYFAGSVNYPMRSFSLCRIKKVRRR